MTATASDPSAYAPNIDWTAAWATLRRRWCGAGRPTRTSADLADHLSAVLGRPISRQRVAQWATGSDPDHARRPPFDVVSVLLTELGLDLRVDARGRTALVPAASGSAQAARAAS